MKKYFLHNGTESSGPFSFDELRAMKIAKTTPVWFEGMEKWKYAKDVEELSELVAVTPPPFQVEEVVSPKPTRSTSNAAFLGLSKNGFIAVVAIIFIITTVVFKIIQNNRIEELEAKNKKTEIENRRIELEEIERKKDEQEKIEQKLAEEERNAKEKKQSVIDRISEIESEMAVIKDNLNTAKEKLAKASDFKVLRTSSEKSEELKKIKKEIEDFEKELEDLEAEQNRLNLELDKIN